MLKSRSVTRIVVILFIPCVIIGAQTKRPRPSKSSSAVSEADVMALANRLGVAKREVTSAASSYKASLLALLEFQEEDVKSASDTVRRRKEMLVQKIISTKEVEESERALIAAQDTVKGTNRQIADADDLITEAKLDELNTMNYARRLLTAKGKRERTPVGRVYYVRFIVVGELTIYEYSGALRGEVIKHRAQVKYDSRRSF